MENELLMNSLRVIFGELYHTISVFDKDAFRRIPAGDGWSPVQVCEHIIKFSSGIPDRHTETTGRPYDQQVETIRQLFLNFSIQMKSPEFVQPGNPVRDQPETIHLLQAALVRLEDKIKNADLTLLCKDIELPVFGYLTRYEWIKFIEVHIERHVHQLKKLPAS